MRILWSRSAWQDDGVDDGSGSPGRFVAVEGATGVGKTTVAAYLGASLNATVLTFPPEFIAFRASMALDERVSPVPRLAYYVAAGLDLSSRIEAELDRHAVVSDRYAASPLAMLEAEQVLSSEDVIQLAGPFLRRLRAPDLTLLLVADHATASERLVARMAAGGPATIVHRRAVDSAAFFERWQEHLRARAARMGPVFELDTTDATVDQTCRTALAAAVRRAPSS
jgi:thymidylate kinase